MNRASRVAFVAIGIWKRFFAAGLAVFFGGWFSADLTSFADLSGCLEAFSSPVTIVVWKDLLWAAGLGCRRWLGGGGGVAFAVVLAAVLAAMLSVGAGAIGSRRPRLASGAAVSAREDGSSSA